MRAVKSYGHHDARVVDAPMPTICEDDDAISKLAAARGCGSHRWSDRGIDSITVGHEYCGVVHEVGPARER
jgi:threonine dehydrogenase-like Zn-dependent dehydrogenase